MNLVVLRGNLTKDPEVREVTANGAQTKVCNVSVAVNDYFTKKDGTKSRDTTFVDCEAWDSGAETIGKIFAKGDPILLEGRLKTESWEVEGQRRSRIKVRVSRFEKLYRSSQTDDEPTAEKEGGDEKPAPAGQDIPF